MAIRKNSAIMDLINGMDLRLGYVGYASVDRQWKTSNLATPFNRLYLIERGTGLLASGEEEMILEPGHAYLLPAGLPCTYRCDDTLSLLFFHFNLAKPDQIDMMEGVGHLSVIPFPEDQLAQLKELCEKKSYADAFAVICTVNDLVLEMCRKYRFRWNDPPVYSPYVAGAISSIGKQLSAKLRVEELAKESYISSGYLSRRFREEVGVSIKQYINMQLINAAQWRLGNTGDSVEKIGNDLGFCNQFYFSEFFKKHCRVSPMQYRHGTKY